MMLVKHLQIFWVFYQHPKGFIHLNHRNLWSIAFFIIQKTRYFSMGLPAQWAIANWPIRVHALIWSLYKRLIMYFFISHVGASFMGVSVWRQYGVSIGTGFQTHPPATGLMQWIVILNSCSRVDNAIYQAPVIGKLDNTIRWINPYPPGLDFLEKLGASWLLGF